MVRKSFDLSSYVTVLIAVYKLQFYAHENTLGQELKYAEIQSLMLYIMC